MDSTVKASKCSVFCPIYFLTKQKRFISKENTKVIKEKGLLMCNYSTDFLQILQNMDRWGKDNMKESKNS